MTTGHNIVQMLVTADVTDEFHIISVGENLALAQMTHEDPFWVEWYARKLNLLGKQWLISLFLDNTHPCCICVLHFLSSHTCQMLAWACSGLFNRSLEFEDGLRTGVLLGGYWLGSAIVVTALSPGTILIEVQVGPLGGIALIWTPVRPNSNLLGSAHQWCWIIQLRKKR